MPWRYYAIMALLSVLALSGLLALVATRAEQVSSTATVPEIGAVAPDFVLSDLNGTQVRLTDYRDKKVVLLIFWAPWCPACRFEMPTTQELYRRFQAQGLEILAISIDQGNQQATVDYAAENRLPFPVLLDPRQTIMDRYHVTFIPTHVLVDRQGHIRHLHIGPKDW